MRAMKPRRDSFWLLAALVFGVVVLPFLVHATGLRVLGEYAEGGAGQFFLDFLRGLATLKWFSWVLALGPVMLVALWRGAWRLGSSARG